MGWIVPQRASPGPGRSRPGDHRGTAGPARENVGELWSIGATWWCRVPEGQRPGLAAALAREPRVRLAATLAGSTNFLFTMWLHDPGEIPRVQGWLEQQVPQAQISDVAVTLRNYKRVGWLLDAEGRATGDVVPVWPPQRALGRDGGAGPSL